MQLSKKKSIKLLLVSALLIAAVIYHRWVHYLLHLAAYQVTVIFSAEPIDQLLETDKTSAEQKEALHFIKQVKEFGRQLYGLQNSESYSKAVMLDREHLGYNLTIAREFKLEPEEFYFVIGSFAYLGFFDEDLKNSWKNRFLEEGYDVHESIIGAYSTLGWFSDPVFSTYLDSSKYWLARLILHEMAHEKLYFNDDTAFSESMASFIEKPAAVLFLSQYQSNNDDIFKLKTRLAKTARDDLEAQIKKESRAFHNLLAVFKTRLQNIYTSNMSDLEKRSYKKKAFQELKVKLEKVESQYMVTQLPQRLLKYQLNNASLAQFERYTPVKNGFKMLLKDCGFSYNAAKVRALLSAEKPIDSQELSAIFMSFQCWFSKLEQLNSCTSLQRRPFIEKELPLKKITAGCSK